jgi:hypothetical protein
MALSREYDILTPPDIAPGGGGSYDDPMEARLTRVEDILVRLEPAVGRIDAAVTKLTDSVHKVEIDLAELKGRVSQLPTTLQLLGFIIAIFAAAGPLKYFVR